MKAWVDRYAARFQELMDPIWEEQIRDPKDRWFKEGQEDKNLFRFKPKAGEKLPEA